MRAFRDFVAELLDSEGAAVELAEPDGLDVVLPAGLRAATGLAEFARLGFGTTLPVGAQPISLEGDWLGRFGALLGERGRLAERQLVVGDHVPPPSDPHRLLDGVLDLPNATWRLQGSQPAWTRCLLLAFRYTAVADEKRDGLIWIGFNQGTGAVLEGELLARLRALATCDVDWKAPEVNIRALPAAADADMLAARLQPLVEHHVRRDLAAFVNALRRRLDRDSGRIYEYHDDLRRAALTKLAALASATGEKAEADRRRETSRIAVIEREYAAKLDDLRHNYALRVSIDWMQALALFAPVHRYGVLVKRRRGERIIHVDWHPAVRLIEPLPCEWGAGQRQTRLVCDDRLHLTDIGGQAPCRSCGKPWCRACHPTGCPRCGQPA